MVFSYSLRHQVFGRRWIALILLIGLSMFWIYSCSEKADAESNTGDPGISVLLVDTDRIMADVDVNIYGQFLEHINHSVVDGLFAEQIRGRGFEAEDFNNYWNTLTEDNGEGSAEVITGNFKNGEKCVRLEVHSGTIGIKQGRVYVEKGYNYDGSVWLKPDNGSVDVTFRIIGSDGSTLAEAPLETSGSDWQESAYNVAIAQTDTQATVEVAATGDGSILVDYVSMMRADVRKNGMLRPDLVEALQGLKAPFIRWPGGSFASIYKWKDGIGPHVSRKYHPNAIWGDYSDYYGFGTEEFMDLAQRLDTDPLIVLPATTTDPEAVQYAMDWVHYLIDPPTTKWGKMRASNGHREPYDVPYFQIDNEPMNHGLTPDQYAEIVNVYGSRLRKIAPDAKIVACGQKRSNDMIWSEKVIDISGDNFDILACHNYEYENENYETGIRRINDYLVKLREYVRHSDHPNIEIAVLEWGLCRSYDWRAGLHSAGSLIMYEKLSPELDMTSPALLMRNTTDDPTWRAFIYHDHVSWFPGSGYVVEKLFRDHYAPKRYASNIGTFRVIDNPMDYFDDISRMKPQDWQPGTVDAIATGSADGQRIVVKAVNYEGNKNTLIVRLQGSTIPDNADVTLYTITAELMDKPSMSNPDKLDPVEKTIPYTKDMTIDLPPYTVALVEVNGK